MFSIATFAVIVKIYHRRLWNARNPLIFTFSVLCLRFSSVFDSLSPLSLQTVECNVKQGRIKSTYIRNMRSATLTSRLAFQEVNKRQFISQLNCSAYSREHNDRWVVSDSCMVHCIFFPFIFAKPFGHCASVLPLCVTGNIFLLNQFISVRETR